LARVSYGRAVARLAERDPDRLAVVCDDDEMGITEVVRGDDLLSSTPRQLALYDALGLQPPGFLHVPLVLGPDGRRLSKRHGATPMATRREAGESAAQLIGELGASLGLIEAGAKLSAHELLAEFDLAKLLRTPATVAH